MRSLTVAAILSSILLAGHPAGATEQFQARVVNVADGDTITALDANNRQVKVRLANIDAPETGHGRCRPGQPFSDRSKQHLSNLVKGKVVTLVCTDTDRYGRSICDVVVDGTTASRSLAQAGMAWANRANPRYLRDNGVAQAEQNAIQQRAGLWADRQQIPPWEWRKAAWNIAPGCTR